MKKHPDHILKAFLFFALLPLFVARLGLPFEVAFDSDKPLLDVDLETLSPAVRAPYFDGVKQSKAKDFKKAEAHLGDHRNDYPGDPREGTRCGRQQWQNALRKYSRLPMKLF